MEKQDWIEKQDWGFAAASLNVAVICGNLNPSTRMARSRGLSTARGRISPGLPEAIFGASGVCRLESGF
jgi:hypothetical protein